MSFTVLLLLAYAVMIAGLSSLFSAGTKQSVSYSCL